MRRIHLLNYYKILGLAFFVILSCSKVAWPAAMPNMASPSPEQIEDAYAKVENLQQTDPELFRQLEEEGKKIILQLAKEDPKQLEEFAKSFGLSADQLVEEAQKPSAPIEVTPTEEAPEIPAPEAPAVERPPKPTGQPEKPAAEKRRIEAAMVSRVLSQAIDLIDSLRTKMASSDLVYTELRALELDLLSLSLLLPIINTDEHYDRIAAGIDPDFMIVLETLVKTLISQEPLVAVSTPGMTPYDLLDVPQNATSNEIERKFKKLEKKIGPAAVEKKLKAEGLSGDDLKRQVKAARITFETIQDAYEELMDPETRRDIVDREIQLVAEQNKVDEISAKDALKKIREALSDALYSQTLISKLEEYLQKYAPEQLKRKKEQEKLEKKHLEEQKKRSQRPAVSTPGESYESRINIPMGIPSSPASYGGTAAWSPESYMPGGAYGPSSYYQQGSGSGTRPSSGESKGSEATPGGKKSEAPMTSTAETISEKEAKKIDTRTIESIMKSIDKELGAFGKKFFEDSTQKLISSLKDTTAKLEEAQTNLKKVSSDITKKIEEKKEPEKKGTEKTEEAFKDISEDDKKTLQSARMDITKYVDEANNFGRTLSENLKLEFMANELTKLQKKITTLGKTPTEKEYQTWLKLFRTYTEAKEEKVTPQKGKKPAKKKEPRTPEKALQKLQDQLEGPSKSVEASGQESNEVASALDLCSTITTELKKIAPLMANYTTQSSTQNTQQNKTTEQPKK